MYVRTGSVMRRIPSHSLYVKYIIRIVTMQRIRWGLVKGSVQYRRRGPYEEETCVFAAWGFGMELCFLGGG